MRDNSADRNILFGIIAMQLDFISRGEFVSAIKVWLDARERSIEDVLVQAGSLSREGCDILSPLVHKHVEMHSSSPELSLASLDFDPNEIRSELATLGDPKIDTSLSLVSSDTLPAHGDDSNDASPTVTLAQTSTTPGRYGILRPHAEGGLGLVSVAQDHELHREVALKEIQPRFANHGESRERFLREAEVTGGLEHPGIVPVYGLGRYPDGRPFYAMRLIKGESLKDAIGEYHATRTKHSIRSSTKASQQVFELRRLVGRVIDVCHAIEYAHSRGIIHRDIKPANIMLGKYGESLVVDWGLAKFVVASNADSVDSEPSIEPRTTSDSSHTQAGRLIGTPSYMSPEQAAGRLELIGRTSDVFSLGATLYCLLTGRPPFLGSDQGEILQDIQRDRYPPASEIVSTSPPALEAIARKAMSHEPKDRYQSAAELGIDLERWIADEPVACCPEPLLTSSIRWMKRHQTKFASLLAASIVAFIALILATVLFGFKNQELNEKNTQIAKQNRQINEANENLDQANQSLNRRIIEYMSEAFGLTDPGREGPTVTLQEVLVHTFRRLDSDFEADPMTIAQMSNSIGNALMQLGDYSNAIEVRLKAYSIYQDSFGDEDPQAIKALSDLATSYHRNGQYAESIPRMEQVLRTLEFKNGENDPDTLSAMSNLAVAYQESEQIDKSIELLKRVQSLSESTSLETQLTAIGNLSGALRLAGRAEEAIPLLREAYQRACDELGKQNPLSLGLANNLAMMYQATDQNQQAYDLLTDLRDEFRNELGQGHPYTLVVENNLALSYYLNDEIDSAALVFEQNLATKRTELGDGHPSTVNAMSNLANVYDDLSRHEEAEELHIEALARHREQVGAELQVASDLTMLARNQVFLRKFKRAETYARQSLAIFQGKADDHWRYFHAQALVGVALSGEGKVAEAESYLREGYEGMKEREDSIPPLVRSRLKEVEEEFERVESSK